MNAERRPQRSGVSGLAASPKVTEHLAFRGALARRMRAADLGVAVVEARRAGDHDEARRLCDELERLYLASWPERSREARRVRRWAA